MNKKFLRPIVFGCASTIRAFGILTIINLCLFAQPQSPATNVDHYSSDVREPSLAIWPNGDGKTVIATWQDDGTANVFTTKSTDGGQSWGTSHQTNIPVPTGARGVADAKLACRVFSSSPELLVVYKMYTSAGEGLSYAYSNDMGASWSDPIQVQAAVSHEFSERPYIITDPSNNVYIIYTQKNYSTTYVFCKVIGSSTHDVPSAATIIQTDNVGYTVDVNDVAIDDDANIYALWRKKFSNGLAELWLAKSTDQGTNWPSTVVVNNPGSTQNYTLPPKSSYYDDYAAMAISHDPCTQAQTMYVAYTSHHASTSDYNPSDLFLSSMPFSSMTWSTPAMISNDDLISTSNWTSTTPCAWQFEPELAEDGRGGVFVLYYSAQAFLNLGTPSVTNAMATLFESSPRSNHSVLSTHSQNVGEEVADYIGLLWNPILKAAHAIWTDHPGSGNSNSGRIFARNLEASYPHGSDDNPEIGYLGYSNQRRIVSIGGTAYAIGTKNVASGDILYSQKTGTQYWTTPSVINTNHSVYGAPAIGVYERGAGIDESAIAVAWIDETASPTVRICIKTMEMNCAENPVWSDVKTIEVGTSNYYDLQDVSQPVIAPLTAKTSGFDGRCLIGWVVVFAENNGGIRYFTLLRGPQAGTQLLHNQSWKDYTANVIIPGVTDNLIISNYQSTLKGILAEALNHYSFVTITSNESNANGVSNKEDETHEIVFAGQGSRSYTGVYAMNVQFNTSGIHVGEINSTTTPKLISDPPPTNRKQHIIFHADRNPSVTITSTGQKLAVWEDLDGAQVMLDPHMKSQTLGYSKIQLAQTDVSGPESWSKIKDIITATTDNNNFGDNSTTGWLRNPSITAFPCTPLVDATGNGDQDPGAAELLFWEQNKMHFEDNGTWAHVNPAPNLLHERHFYETKKDNHSTFTGGWEHQDTQDPLPGSPRVWSYDDIHSQTGSNAQRSFGVHNTGPQFHSSPTDVQLYDLDGGQYFHGLSWGLGNEVTISSGAILKTSKTATPDIGAFKGTYSSALGVQLYRSETRIKDSSVATFKWGKLYVEDSMLDLPIREIMLHDGKPDSNGYASHTAMRDSIFATEWFDWPVSAKINYDRFMLFPLGGHYENRIDTTFIDSVAGDTNRYYQYPVFDTIPVFHSDSTLTDQCFYDSTVRMKYTVELVHLNGHIDTIETLVYKPFGGQFIEPRTVHVVNGGYFPDTVMLRVRGDIQGILDDDSMVAFERETMLSNYVMSGEKTVAINGDSGGIILPDSCFEAIGPYPNPALHSAHNVSVLVHYCSSGATLSAQVYTSLGVPVGSAVTCTSDGQLWDRLELSAPSTAGSYYIVVAAGGSSATLPYSIY